MMSGIGGGRAVVPTSLKSYTESAPFACHWQCTECGFQIQDEQPEVPSYRKEASAPPSPFDSKTPQQACSHCGETSWANLREGGVVEALKVQDEERQFTRGANRSGAVKLVLLSVWTVAVLIFVFFTDGFILLPLAIGTALWMMQSAYHEYLSGKHSARAGSWRHAPVPRGRVRSRLEGLVVSATLLQAPLSGRPCVAYELGVRHDSNGEGDDSTWTLLEQDGVAFEVAGESIDQPYFQLERTVYADALSPASAAALRRRGIDASHPGYTVFETVVELGDNVVVERRRTGLVVRT